MPFPDDTFDGVWLNEVLEHVVDEEETLLDLRRVLRPGGHLVVVSPNRFFPFEGHGMQLGGRKVNMPIPFLPWMPSALSRHVMRARNYWPGELAGLIARNGFEVVHTESVMPVFEVFPWLPLAVARWLSGTRGCVRARARHLPHGCVHDGGGASTVLIHREEAVRGVLAYTAAR